MPKKIVLLFPLLFCLFNLNAQKKNQLKLAIEAGILPLTSNAENLGMFLYAEPKLKVLENTYIGLRFGATLNTHTFENKDNTQFNIYGEYDHGVVSFVPNLDYYLDINDYTTYLGVGLGVYLSSDIDASRKFIVNPSEDVYVIRVNKQLGLLVRGGMELNRLRLGVEYSLISKADIKIPDGQIIGTVATSYFGVSAGFIFGVGK